MKALKIGLMGVVVAIALSAMAISATPAKAQALYNNNLNNLLITNGLFTGYSAQNLAGLIAVDNVTTGGTMASGSTNLNNLLITNGLFTGYNAANLSGLIAVNNIYGNGLGY